MAVARFSGPAFQRAREAAGLTRAQVAARLDVAAADPVRIWETGVEQPRPALIPRLAALVDVAALDLLEGAGDPPSLSALRLMAGLSRADVVAAATTLTKMTYVRLDAGVGARRLPPPAVVAELADVLGVSPGAVVDGIVSARDYT